MEQARHVEATTTKTERNARSRDCGINRLSILRNIPAVEFPASFPFDLMPLIENLISNYVLLVSGNFKGLTIGRLTMESNRFIPSAFGRCIPNIAEDRTYFTAEAYLVWFPLCTNPTS